MPMTEEQNTMLRQLHAEIVGSIDKPGMIHEFKTMKSDVVVLKEYKAADEKFKNRAAGGLAVGTMIFGGIWHWIIELFKK